MTRVLAFIALFAGSSLAETYQWGSSFGAPITQSDGTNVTTVFTLELGYFANGFTATAVNVDQWNLHWVRVDLTSYNAGNQAFRDDVTFLTAPGDPNTHVTLLDNPTVLFPENARLYVWAYDDRNLANGSEWGLFTGEPNVWKIPDAPTTTHELPTLLAINDATTAVVGTLGLETASSSDDIVGGGERTGVPSGAFSLQTHFINAPIPEPSAATLALWGCWLALRRRR